jgi:hypothetical protein
MHTPKSFKPYQDVIFKQVYASQDKALLLFEQNTLLFASQEAIQAQ